MTCTQQTWIGAYVLDALEPDETAEVQRHIAGCPTCQDEVVNLSWIPALLRNVRLEDVEELDEGGVAEDPRPAPVLERVLASMRAARETGGLRRPAAALAAVAAAATLAGAAAIVGGSTSTPTARLVALRTVDPHSHVRAAATLSARRWGTEVHLRLSWVPAGEHCSLVAHARDGRTDVAATWVASYHGTADVPGTTAIPLDQLREVDIVAANGRQLARLVVPHQNR
jgi:anti-sigma factor RsiW